MNYLVTFDESIPFRAAGTVGEIDSAMFYDTDPDVPRHRTDPYIADVDDVISAMNKCYPEVKSYKIMETLLSIEDIEENDKARAKQEC